MASKKNMTADAVASPAMSSKPEKDYEAESAFDTIVRAEEHKNDPKMMDRVKKHAGRKLKAMKGLHDILGSDEEKQEVKSTDDLRSIRNKKATSMGNMG